VCHLTRLFTLAVILLFLLMLLNLALVVSDSVPFECCSTFLALWTRLMRGLTRHAFIVSSCLDAVVFQWPPSLICPYMPYSKLVRWPLQNQFHGWFLSDVPQLQISLVDKVRCGDHVQDGLVLNPHWSRAVQEGAYIMYIRNT
jgi:hypothetical protein